MMIMGRRDTLRSNPTVQVPPWDDPTADIHSPFSLNAAFSDDLTVELAGYDDVYESAEYDEAVSCDHFRMYEFKVRRCARGRSHDWTDCPYAHPGEKARRRDPRRFRYSGDPCPEFRKGVCKRGDGCEFAHGVFECWLHPSRYRTQPCKDGVRCRRPICFFAHTADELRVVLVGQPESYDGSPSRLAMGNGAFGSSPTSTLYSPQGSPPISPLSSNSVSELASTISNMQISKPSRLSMSPMGGSRNPFSFRPGSSTPSRPGLNAFELWDQGCAAPEEPMMERVESGKELRAKIYAKLSRENSLANRVDSSGYL